MGRNAEAAAQWHDTVLRQKYHDPRKLKAALDEMYGPGNYMVKTRASRYILRLPSPLQPHEREQLERQIEFHYSS